MFVNFNCKEYKVRFDHTPFKADAKGHPVGRRETVCTISVVDQVGGQTEITDIAQASSIVSKVDTFSKAYGRLASFQRALRDAIEQGAFENVGAQAWRTFMKQYATDFPKGLETAQAMLKDKAYSDASYWY